MSLFEYAQEVVSKKLEREKPMLSVSMGGLPMTDKMQTYMNRPVLPNTPAGKMDGSPFMEAAEKRGIPTTNRNMNMMVDLVNRGVPLEEAANLTEQKLMPTAQGGGLSSVQNSLNINGQPHRLAYINPSEENLLKSLGGSGKKIDGIPAYFDPGNDSDPSSAEEGIGIGFDTSPAEAEAAVNAAQAEEAAVAAAIGEAEAYGNPEAQMNAPDLGFFGPGMTIDEQNFYDKANLNRQDFKEQKSFFESLKDNFNLKNNPLSILSPTLTIGKSVIDSINSQKGFGLDPLGVEDEIGPETDLDDDDGTDAGGDDIIIREKIAAVRQVPVEEVTVAEVKRAKRLTAAQRVAGTRLEDILDDIYGSGKGAGLLGIPTNNTGTA